MTKDFNGWNNIKQGLDASPQLPTFKEREIWWCSVGVNVGYEIYGKGETFSRPVLVLRKISKYTFFGVPLTSKRKEGTYFCPISFHGVAGSALLDQHRVFDRRRLQSHMGYLTGDQFDEIRECLRKLI